MKSLRFSILLATLCAVTATYAAPFPQLLPQDTAMESALQHLMQARADLQKNGNMSEHRAHALQATNNAIEHVKAQLKSSQGKGKGNSGPHAKVMPNDPA